MTNKDRLKVGISGFLEPINNQARWGDKKPVPVTVTKVGRKYFEVVKDGLSKFPIQMKIEDLEHKSDYSPDWRFYFDEQHILDIQEHTNLTSYLRSIFGGYSNMVLTLDKLRRITEIVKEPVDK